MGKRMSSAASAVHIHFPVDFMRISTVTRFFSVLSSQEAFKYILEPLKSLLEEINGEMSERCHIYACGHLPRE